MSLSQIKSPLSLFRGMLTERRLPLWQRRGGADGLGLTIALSQLRQSDLASVGPKAFALGRMARAGLPVPPGFVVTTRAFEGYVAVIPEWASLKRALAGVTRDGLTEIEALSRALCSTFSREPIPIRVEEAVRSRLLAFPRISHWAVRSSASDEDSKEASFAGQHDSFLDVRAEDVPARVRDCWLSLFGIRALHYRLRRGIPLSRMTMAVIVQEMVPAAVSGVLFTADPATGDSSRIVIESAPGRGDGVVSGHVMPDRLVLAKRDGDAIALGPGSASSHLPDSSLHKLVELSGQVGRLFEGPLDIEWALCGREVHLLQARSQTGAKPAKSWEEKQVWTNLNTGEVFPQVATPITWSVIRAFAVPLLESVFQLFGADVNRAATVGLVGGRIYFNVNTSMAALRPFWFALARVRGVARALGGGPPDLHQWRLERFSDENLPDVGFSWPKYVLSWPRLLWELANAPRRGAACMRQSVARRARAMQLDFKPIPTAELSRLFPRLVREHLGHWDLLWLLCKAGVLLVFEKVCRDWLGDKELTATYRLFTALGGVPEAEGGLALWQMAALAHADASTKGALLSGAGWVQIRPGLERTEPGRRFLTAWDAFMAEHGHHCRGELELFNARWSDSPEYVLDLVRGYLHSMGRVDPVANHARLAEAREQLTRDCLRRLRNPVKRWVFTWALRGAQRVSIEREVWKNEAVHHIALLRRLLLVLGERLEREGILDQREDVFFLELAEIEPAGTGCAEFDPKGLVAARRKEYAANLALIPPPRLVTGRYNPDLNTQAEEPRDGGGVLTGIPVFPGTVTGLARVIVNVDDHEQVRAGEILVVPFTDPAWTPYLLAAAGMVADQGGILSHGSIIAREYGLPSVTNVTDGTRRIRTGDLIQLDGELGRVTILRPGSPAASPPSERAEQVREVIGPDDRLVPGQNAMPPLVQPQHVRDVTRSSHDNPV